jgi:hypothetical protein
MRRRPTAALAELKKEGKCPKDTQHRQVKYLNNIIEADHGKLKQLIRPVRGFKTLKRDYATIKGFEVMRALRKNQVAIFNITHDIRGEPRLVEVHPDRVTPARTGPMHLHRPSLQQSGRSVLRADINPDSEFRRRCIPRP